MNGNLVTIVKNGKLIDIAEDNLCKGDMVVLQAGELVPADLKLVESRGLEVDEFELTGEILPVIKSIDDKDAHLYMSSRITKGSGKGIVDAIGEQTEYGGVLKQEWEIEKPYEFHFYQSKFLFLVALLLPAFALSIAISQNTAFVILSYMLLSAIIILLQNDELFKHLLVTTEVNKLKSYNIQIRDAAVLEKMNNIDIICFDKTGVLTTRQMDVKTAHSADKLLGAGGILHEDSASQLIKKACALCNDVLFFEKIKQATAIDKALISFAQKNGINLSELFLQAKRIYDKPFAAEDRFMACGFELNGKSYYFAKGDPEVILKMCGRYLAHNGAAVPMDAAVRHSNENIVDSINKSGDTAIALAFSSEIPNKVPADYTFLCVLQLENSLQQDVHEVIRQVIENGIRPMMLTGDRAETAVRISEECGISGDSQAYLTGKVIERMSFSEVAMQAAYCSVFARLLPSQKGLIIRLLQQEGHRVAMIGDGPNDGIALKTADAGISFVGNSSPIARRLATILINELADLLKLIGSAENIEVSSKRLMLFRITALSALIFGTYAWVFRRFI